VVWFNVAQASSQVAGIKFGDIRTPDGAAQMVDRLLDRMKPGRNVRRRSQAQ
jgi:arginine repressor